MLMYVLMMLIDKSIKITLINFLKSIHMKHIFLCNKILVMMEFSNNKTRIHYLNNRNNQLLILNLNLSSMILNIFYKIL